MSDDEIEMIEDAIAERVDWFGAIEGAILDKIDKWIYFSIDALVNMLARIGRELKITTRPRKAA